MVGKVVKRLSRIEHCKTCDKVLIRVFPEIDSKEARCTLESQLKCDSMKKKEWDEHVQCEEDPEQKKARHKNSASQPPGLRKQVETKKSRTLEGIRVLGVVWLLWKYKQVWLSGNVKKGNPPKGQRYTFDGEDGLLLEVKHCNPENTVLVQTRVKQGSSLATKGADTDQMHDPEAIDALFARIDTSQKLVSRKRGRSNDAKGTPAVLKIERASKKRKTEADSDYRDTDNLNIMGDFWGGHSLLTNVQDAEKPLEELLEVPP